MLESEEEAKKAHGLLKLAEAKIEVKQYDGARLYLRRALAISQQHIRDFPAVHYRCLMAYGKFLLQVGEAENAVSVLDEALELAKQEYDETDKEHARLQGETTQRLGLAYQHMEDYSKAADLMREAAHLFDLAGEPELQVDQMGTAAYLNLQSKKFHEARNLMDQALHIARRKEVSQEVLAELLLGDTLVSLALNDGPRALDAAVESRAIFSRVLGDHHTSTILSLRYVSIALYRGGRCDEAIILIKQVIDDRYRYYGRNSEAVISDLNDLADMLLKGKKTPRDTIAPLQEALDLANRLLGPLHPTTTDIRGKLMEVHRFLGDLDTCIQLMEEKVKASRTLLKEEPQILAEALQELGEIFMDNGEPQKALVPFNDILQLFKDIDKDQADAGTRMTVAMAHTSMARAYMAAGATARAETQARLAIEEMSSLTEEAPETKEIIADLESMLQDLDPTQRQPVNVETMLQKPLDSVCEKDEHQDSLSVLAAYLADAIPPGLDFHPRQFLEFLQNSISLVQVEKERIIKSLPKLDFQQISRLYDIFQTEYLKFQVMCKENPKLKSQLEELYSKHAVDWDSLLRQMIPSYAQNASTLQSPVSTELKELVTGHMTGRSGITALDNEAASLREQGRLHEAEVCLKRSLILKRRLYKNDETEIAATLNELAELLLEQHIYQPAIPLLMEAEAMLFDEEHYPMNELYYDVLHNRAVAEFKTGNPGESLKQVKKAEKHCRKAFGNDHNSTAYEALHAAETALELEEFDVALEYAEKAMQVYRLSKYKRTGVPCRYWLIMAEINLQRGQKETGRNAFLKYARFYLAKDEEKTIPPPMSFETLTDTYIRGDDEEYNHIMSVFADMGETEFITTLTAKCLDNLLNSPLEKEQARNTADAFAKGMRLMAYAGDAEAAARKMAEGLEVFQNHFGAYHSPMVELLFMAAECAIDFKDANKAALYIEKALSLVNTTECKDAAYAYRLNVHLALLYRHLDRFDEAVEITTRLLEESGKPQAAEYWDPLQLLEIQGETFLHMGAEDSARNSLQKALDIQLNTDPVPERTADLQAKLTDLCRQNGDLQNAVAYGGDALDTTRKLYGNAHSKVADAMRNLANIHLELHDYKKCLQLMEDGLAIWKHISPKSAGTLLSAQDLVSLYSVHLKDSARAKQYMEETLMLCKDLFGENSPKAAQQTSMLGRWYLDMGKITEAEDLFRKAMDMRKTTLGPNHPAIIKSLWDMADIYSKKSAYKKALAVMQEALVIIKHNPGIDELDIADTFFHLTIYALDANQAELALDYIEHANSLFRKHKGPFVTVVGHYHRIKARILRRLGDKNAPLAHYFRACFIFSINDDLSNLWTAYKNIIDSFLSIASGSMAVLYAPIYFYKKAINAIEFVRRGTHELPIDLSSSFLFEREDLYRDLTNTLIITGRFAEAEQVAKVLKRDAYWTVIRGNRNPPPHTQGLALTAFENDAQNLEASLIKEGKNLLKQYRKRTAVTAGNSPAEKDIETLHADLEQVMENYVRICRDSIMKLENHFFRKLKKSSGSTSPDELQKCPLPPGCARIHYFQAEKVLKIVLNAGRYSCTRDVHMHSVELAKKVHDFRAGLHSSRTSPRRAAEELYRCLVAPVIDALRKAAVTTIEISAGGALQLLPFAALFDGKHYLVEEFSLARHSSGASMEEDSEKNWTICAFGASRGTQELADLPHVFMELKGIAAGVGDDGAGDDGETFPGTVFLDDDFTRESLFAAVARTPDIVHIAGHFIFNPAEKNGSYLLLGDGNLLSLEHIIDKSLNFEGIRLVTLSACETALSSGDLNRDSIENLATIVLEKGAHSVLASLWPVFDESTAMIMKSFYGHLKSGNGVSRAEALRLAQLELLKRSPGPAYSTAARRGIGSPSLPVRRDFSHPYYWAPFLLMGDWG